MGVVSTPGVVVQVVGSLGLSFLLWIFGSLVTFCKPCPKEHSSRPKAYRCPISGGLGLYMELASRFPGRSGGDAVFLVQFVLCLPARRLSHLRGHFRSKLILGHDTWWQPCSASLLRCVILPRSLRQVRVLRKFTILIADLSFLP